MTATRFIHGIRRISSFNKIPKGSVIVSTSKCIYENLALEQWIYENCVFSETDELQTLLLWSNKPAVVVGRHQNPWLECNVMNCLQNGIDVARRNSGGGTVFHDDGNLNICFFTHKNGYKRRRNLDLLCAVLNKKWNVGAAVNDRDDIIVGMYKISGTASKLAHNKAYHHCTLLVDVDKSMLKNTLSPNYNNLSIDSKASCSTRSAVVNLSEMRPDMTSSALMIDIIHAFQSAVFNPGAPVISVAPSNGTFPGISDIVEKLKGWDWVYGSTPRFTLTRDNLSIETYHGRVIRITMLNEQQESDELTDVVKGMRLTKEDLDNLLTSCRHNVALPNRGNAMEVATRSNSFNTVVSILRQFCV